MIYLDHNSTTPVLPQVRDAMAPFLADEWGNPSSAYRFGRKAKSAIDRARIQVASLIGANPTEVIFTSCATEGNNTAVHSALISNAPKRHVVTSATEHSSVLNYCRELLKRGCDVTILPVSSDGLVDLHELENAIRADTALVSLMWANNETGVIAPVTEIAEICTKHGVTFHCDAVQAVGKLPIDFRDVPIQFLSLSGHKLGAPKGVGALIVRDGVPFHPLLVGGKQELGRRGGTESVPLIVGLGVACENASATASTWESIARLRDSLEQELLSSLEGVYRNGAACPRLPNTSSVGIPGIDNDALVTYCDRNDVCISSGSACMEDAITPSHVIFAMTGSYERAAEAVRVSLGLDTQLDGVLELTRLIREFVKISQS